MEFTTYLDKDSFLRSRRVIKHGLLVPGTLLTFVPMEADTEPRHGMVVAIHSGQVDVVWQPWTRTAPGTYEHGELRRRLGIPSREEEKRRKWDEKKRRERLGSAAKLYCP